MTLNYYKENAIIQWYNSLCAVGLEKLEQLADGSRLSQLCNAFIPEICVPVPVEGLQPKFLSPDYARVKIIIDENFKTESDHFVDYPQCAAGNKLELAKLLVLLLSIAVLQYLRTQDPALNTLTQLDPETQLEIEEILAVTLNSEDLINKAKIQRVLSRPAKSKRSTRRMGSTSPSAATPVKNTTPCTSTRNKKKLEIQDNIITSPLQNFLNSPKTQEWAQVLTKNKEIIKLKTSVYDKECENESLRLQIAELKKELEKQKNENNKQKTEIRNLQVNAENLEKELKEEKEKEKENFTNIISELKKEVSSLKEENAELNLEIKKPQKEKVKLTEVADSSVNSRMLELENELEEKSRDIEELHRHIDEMKICMDNQALVASIHEENLRQVLQEVEVNKMPPSPGEKMSKVIEADYKNLLEKCQDMRVKLDVDKEAITKLQQENLDLQEMLNIKREDVAILGENVKYLEELLNTTVEESKRIEERANKTCEEYALGNHDEVVKVDKETVLTLQEENIQMSNSTDLNKIAVSENTEAVRSSVTDVADAICKTLKQLFALCDENDVSLHNLEKDRIVKAISNQDFHMYLQFLKQFLLNGMNNGIVCKERILKPCEFVNNASSTLNALNKENTELKEEISKCMNTQADQACTIQQLQLYCRKLEKDFEEKEKGIDYLKEKVKKYKQYSAEMYKLQEKYGALKKAFTELENANKDLLKKYSTQFESLNKLMGEARKFKGELDREKEAKRTLSARIAGLQCEVSELNFKNKQLSEELKAKDERNLTFSDERSQCALEEDSEEVKNEIVNNCFKRNILALNNKKRSSESATERNRFASDRRATINERTHDLKNIREDESLLSNKSLCEPLFNKSLHGTLPLYNDDEEGYFNHNSLMECKRAFYKMPQTNDKHNRLRELQRRNTLCLPHLRSSYPVELQCLTPGVSAPEALGKQSTSKPSVISFGPRNSSTSTAPIHQMVYPITRKRKSSDGRSSTSSVFKLKSSTPVRKYRKVVTPSSLKRFMNIRRVKDKTSQKT